ncbi:hypothetical protein HDU85_001995 [Gaertneriomyces sp. JEL0708]|nr:hypothetical protein HDU85_001995 [Gaertneriomyces sp. JEL0708]
MSFQLSANLLSHSQDVKATAAISDDFLVTGSRDTSVICWRRIARNAFEPHGTFNEHSHFVNSMACIPASQDHPNGLVVSGSSDKTIQVFDPSHPEKALYTLLGHESNVCALAVAPNCDILSGSWDYTAKVWRNFECIHTVKHEHSVWAILGLEDGTYLTASADKTIKMWNGDKCVRTFTGHTDAVRGLALLPGQRFVSCSNDGLLRIWSLDGKCLHELAGHTSFVYSVSALPTGEIVSSGEDRTARVWRDGECIQTIMHPCTSVWSVAALPNGDFVTGSSDGVARVFTRSGDRVASAEDLKAYEDSLASQSIPSSQLGDVDKSKLPSADRLDRPGDKDGQVIMINTGNAVEAHQWSQAEYKWTLVGQVVDAVGSSRKSSYEGRDYDFVFDVDLGDNVPLKLPYNASDNPYNAAQEFIWKHELSQGYLDQIAQFIIQNAGATTLGSSTTVSDPFTGSGRYIPGGAPPPSAPSKPRTPPASSSVRYIPHGTYTAFKAANLNAILTKIVQFNADLEKDMDYASISLQSEEEKNLENIVKQLENPGSVGKTLAGSHVRIFRKVALDWPAERRFPGVDLLRLVVLHSPLILKDMDLVKDLDQIADFSGMPTTTVDKVRETNAMLALRLLANIFTLTEGQNMVFANRNEIFNLIKVAFRFSQNKNFRTALATVFLNFAVLLRERADVALRVELIQSLSEMIRTETDGESEFRAMVALGTLINGDADCLEAAKLMDLGLTIRRARTVTGETETKLKEVEKELIGILRQ